MKVKEFLDLSSTRLHSLDCRVVEELVQLNQNLKHIVLAGVRLPVHRLRPGAPNARRRSRSKESPKSNVKSVELRGPKYKLADADFNLLSRMLKHSPLTSLTLSNGALVPIQVGSKCSN
jgi:hypothetical protein